MLIKTLLFLFVCILLTTTISAATADRQFETLANSYIAKLLETTPEYATQLGNHAYDNRLSDYSLAGVAQNRRLTQDYLAKLNKIDFAELSKTNNVDARIMRENLEFSLFQINDLREYESNPLTYNVGGALDGLMSRDFAPLAERLKSLKGRLEAIPNVVAAAKTNLKNPPRIYTETAIDQNAGVIGLIKDDLQQFVDLAPQMKTELQPARDKAIAALTDYGNWLKNDLLPRSNGDFRLGDHKFRQKLKFALSSDLSKEELLKRAETDLKATQKEMAKVALSLYPKLFPNGNEAAKTSELTGEKFAIKSVLDKLAEQRPTNETIVAQAKKDLLETTEFVRAKNLVTIPTESVKVIVMPEYARGTAVAYCDSTGYFEKQAATNFAISPTPDAWTPEVKKSFFREYNDFMLQDLTVHEAMPGHYLQLMHANKFNAPTPIRAIFLSGSFIEGWAVYAEQMMAENGYGGNETRMQQLKMRLRVIINSIIDQKIHTAQMSENDAIALMMNEGFQERGEAVGKWKRAQLSSTQLSTYYVGVTEVNDLRRAYQTKHGKQTDLKTMHDAILSFGSPAAKYVKEMLEL